MNKIGNGKKLAIWGYGKRGKHFLEKTKLQVDLIIDNGKEKKMEACNNNCKIVSADEVDNWKAYFVFVTPAKYDLIVKTLMDYGLVPEDDFMLIDDYLFAKEVSLECAVDVLKSIYFNNGKPLDMEAKIRTRQEYCDIVEKNKHFIEYERSLVKLYDGLPFRAGMYHGFCACCNRKVAFHIEQKKHKGRNGYVVLPWNESAGCPICKMGSRQRYMVEYLTRTVDKEAHIYINEKITNTYKKLAGIFDDITGSEYLGEQYRSGEYVGGVLHEDAMNLSFQNDSFDAYFSLDVFEHISNYRKAFSEAYRILKTGGNFIFTVPMSVDQKNTETVAEVMDDGTMHYMVPPYYHGNPLSEEGSLVFHEYSWDIADFLRQAGFRDVWFMCYASAEKGYFGYIRMVVVHAVK